MNILKQNAEYLDPTGVHPYQFIEKIGRTCYKSEDKITEDSAKGFIQMLFNRKHLAMLEHAHVFFKCNAKTAICLITEYANRIAPNWNPEWLKYINISQFSTNDSNIGIISGSMAAFITLFSRRNKSGETSTLTLKMNQLLAEAYPEIFSMEKASNLKFKMGMDVHEDFIDSLPDMYCDMDLISREDFINLANTIPDDTEKKHVFATHMTHTLLLTTNRGVTHELVRHRPPSFAQESTRYVNYSKAKFGDSIAVTLPPFFEEGNDAYAVWKDACEYVENAYMQLTKVMGVPAQQARDILPQSTKADIVMTATENEWQHVINLRYHGTTGAPHPEMVELMSKAYPLLTNASDGRLS